MERRRWLQKAKRVVVKVGSALLSTPDDTLDTRFVAKLAREIKALRDTGREVILVSSGAIAAGMLACGCRRRPRTIPAQQALAAIGQPRLMQAYARSFARHGLAVAQILLTAADIHHRQRYAHARNALFELLRLGVVPVFNENDTLAVEELKFGDNDALSAHITNLAGADCLVILTDVDGLYTANPRTTPGAERVPEVARIDAAVRAAGSARAAWPPNCSPPRW